MVEYAPGDGISGAGPAGMLTVRWRYRVKITNLLQDDALEVVVIKTNDSQLQNLPVHHIRGLEHIELKGQLEKNLNKDAVVAAGHDFHGVLEPPELRDLKLILSYKSSRGLTFYTDYERSRSGSPNKYKWSIRRPKDARKSACAD
jgi:hypothetical protein